MDDKLKAKIAAAYQRQSGIIEARDRGLQAISSLQGKVDPWLWAALIDTAYSHYRGDLDLVNTQIKTLEAVRDA